MMDITTEIGIKMAKNPTTIKLLWHEFSGTANVDPITGSDLRTSVEHSESINGFVYFVSAAMVDRRFAEIQAGDAIVDIPPATVIEGRDSLEFEIDGRRWMREQVSGELEELWDTLDGNTRTVRTLHLTQKR